MDHWEAERLNDNIQRLVAAVERGAGIIEKSLAQPEEKAPPTTAEKRGGVAENVYSVHFTLFGLLKIDLLSALADVSIYVRKIEPLPTENDPLAQRGYEWRVEVAPGVIDVEIIGQALARRFPNRQFSVFEAGECKECRRQYRSGISFHHNPGKISASGGNSAGPIRCHHGLNLGACSACAREVYEKSSEPPPAVGVSTGRVRTYSKRFGCRGSRCHLGAAITGRGCDSICGMAELERLGLLIPEEEVAKAVSEAREGREL